MPLVGFESTTPVFEMAKTVHALDRASTVIGYIHSHCCEIQIEIGLQLNYPFVLKINRMTTYLFTFATTLAP
jgi:hypothetical protein